MNMPYRLTLLVGAAALAGSATAQPAQKVTGPVATYWMSAQTQTGFGLGAMGGGGAPNMGALMGAMMGGGGPQHMLNLQLGSSRKVADDPAAEHLAPPALGAGPALPLVTPQAPPPATPVPQT